MVGTGRGSNYNAYEYVGFGTEPALGKRQLEEAEELFKQGLDYGQRKVRW
ncbi:MAG: hypothetical protein Ct9H300mP11_29410 [Chloroflexota bacterium]|nr:MAG: hypothetical protein Ct9H300mP11_29410 [Chloroflexota bacterium]